MTMAKEYAHVYLNFCMEPGVMNTALDKFYTASILGAGGICWNSRDICKTCCLYLWVMNPCKVGHGLFLPPTFSPQWLHMSHSGSESLTGSLRPILMASVGHRIAHRSLQQPLLVFWKAISGFLLKTEQVCSPVQPKGTSPEVSRELPHSPSGILRGFVTHCGRRGVSQCRKIWELPS